MIVEIEKFFEDRKAVISKHSLCKEAGITTQLLGMIFRGERDFTDKVQMKILPVLQKYGFESSLILANSGNSLKILMAVFIEFKNNGVKGGDISDLKSFNEELKKCNQDVVFKFRQLNNIQLEYSRNLLQFDLIYSERFVSPDDSYND
jgi:hypothetical protein